MIDSNREEFEKLPKIRAMLKKGVFEYTDFTKSYNFIDAMTCINARPSQHKDHGYLNGAWYAYQEQQKKLDCCREENKAHLEKIDELQARNEVMSKNTEAKPEYVPPPPLIKIGDSKGNKDEN